MCAYLGNLLAFGSALKSLYFVAIMLRASTRGQARSQWRPPHCRCDAPDGAALRVADIQGGQVAQTPDKKQRTHQKDNGEAHLRDDKNAPKTKALAADSRSPAPRLE